MFGSMKIQLKEYLNSINHEKKNIMDENPLCENQYPAWVVNHALYGHSDTLLLVIIVFFVLLYDVKEL